MNFKDFTSLSALSGFCGSLKTGSLVCVETLPAQMPGGPPTFRVWYEDYR